MPISVVPAQQGAWHVARARCLVLTPAGLREREEWAGVVHVRVSTLFWCLVQGSMPACASKVRITTGANLQEGESSWPLFAFAG